MLFLDLIITCKLSVIVPILQMRSRDIKVQIQKVAQLGLVHRPCLASTSVLSWQALKLCPYCQWRREYSLGPMILKVWSQDHWGSPSLFQRVHESLSFHLHICVRSDFLRTLQPKQQSWQIEYRSTYQNLVFSAKIDVKDICKNLNNIPLFCLEKYSFLKIR